MAKVCLAEQVVSRFLFAVGIAMQIILELVQCHRGKWFRIHGLGMTIAKHIEEFCPMHSGGPMIYSDEDTLQVVWQLRLPFASNRRRPMQISRRVLQN